MFPSTSKKILFQITGSIAAYKACAVISQLVQNGHQVQVVLSPSANQFVGPATLEGLTSRPVAQGIFTPGEMMGHIEWARWADLFVLCPATANTLNRLASGLSDDLIGSIFLAQNFSRPYLIFPAMNTMMLNHPATQRSLSQLHAWGAKVFETAKGTLACGEVGEGKLLEPGAIVRAIEAALRESDPLASPHSPRVARRILVTAGGTRESIDGVRFITNTSSGRTGVFLAEQLARRGHQVVLLKHQSIKFSSPSANLTVLAFDSFKDLASQMKTALQSSPFDFVIHAAAVADFSIDRIETAAGIVNQNRTKLPSGQTINLRLVPTPKVISSLRDWSVNKAVTVVGFKLTNTLRADERRLAVEKLFQQSQPNFVVANDLTEINEHQHAFNLYGNGGLISAGQSKSDLAQSLVGLVEADPNPALSPLTSLPEPEVPL